jgi:hypothetical protein
MIGLARLPCAGRLAVVRAALAAPAGALLAVARRAAADHPGTVRTEGLSPLMLALVTGGLALAAALLVVVIVMLLTRRPPAAARADE